MWRASFAKRRVPHPERLCRTDQRAGAGGPALRGAGGPRRADRVGRAGAGPGHDAFWGQARDRHELLRPVGGVRITSLANATVKAVRALHLKKERDETGLFVAEGLKV